MSRLLDIEDLVVTYRTSRGPLNGVDGVSLSLHRGETLGIVGESGCGKSSLGRAVVQLEQPARGRILIDGVDPRQLSRRAQRAARARVQMVFQNSATALDPRLRVGTALELPLRVHRLGNRAGRRARVAELMHLVGLREDLANRLPHELSGGQRQRVAIARALALGPDAIVCDEAVSALDVSLQAQVLNVLRRLQAEVGLAYLFISHDLAVVEYLADRVAIMYLGRIVELADREQIWRNPSHPYTRALIDAVPPADLAQARSRNRKPLAGDPPSPFAPPPGCRFHPRCPIARDRCRQEVPELRMHSAGQFAACHYPLAAAAAGTVLHEPAESPGSE